MRGRLTAEDTNERLDKDCLINYPALYIVCVYNAYVICFCSRVCGQHNSQANTKLSLSGVRLLVNTHTHKKERGLKDNKNKLEFISRILTDVTFLKTRWFLPKFDYSKQ